jgi:hypothetical protein
LPEAGHNLLFESISTMSDNDDMSLRNGYDHLVGDLEGVDSDNSKQSSVTTVFSIWNTMMVTRPLRAWPLCILRDTCCLLLIFLIIRLFDAPFPLLTASITGLLPPGLAVGLFEGRFLCGNIHYHCRCFFLFHLLCYTAACRNPVLCSYECEFFDSRFYELV